MKPIHDIRLGIVLIIIVLFQSCSNKQSDVLQDEPVKEIVGKWKVTKLLRNGEDIGKRMDLSAFVLEFKNDGTYQADPALAFVATGDGAYALNDPQYPFTVIFKAKDGQADIPVKFQFPIVKGRRQLNFTCHMGCEGNTYQYDFEPIN